MIEADEKTAITAISGVDLGDNIGVYYHLRTSNAFFTIKTEVPKENPHTQTISDILPGAVFHEMEVADLLGVVFDGHPCPGRLVLSENWPEGVYPLRKDVKANEVKLNPAKEDPQSPEDGKLVKIIIGPQHPALLSQKSLL
jgi:Ni,Fe-hydrogenase III component G